MQPNYMPPQSPYGPPGGPPPYGGPPGAPPPMGGGGDPKAQVQGPGIALIVIGALMLVGQALYLVYTLLYAGLGAVTAASGDSGGVGALMGGVVGMILTIIWMLLSGVIVFGGVKMKNLQSYGFAMASAIMAMLPCTTGYCCVIGLPLGIWALIVLMKPEVKAAFR